jgi:hypothetical protein
MRTTIAIDDAVLEDAKELADRRGITLGELVSDALRTALRGDPGPEPRPFKVRAWGKRGHLPADPKAISDLLLADDLTSLESPAAVRRRPR